MTGSPAVTQAGVRVPSEVTAPVHVLFDDVRLWSFLADRDGGPADGADDDADGDDLLVGWPQQLVRFLDGVARITLVADDETLLDVEHQFGTSPDRIRVVDQAGQQLAVDKWGHLAAVFDGATERDREDVVDAVNILLTDLRDRWGLDAFLSFGCLLGAVRTGHLIGHDTDADVTLLSRHDHPYDVAREFLTLGHLLRDRGYAVGQLSAAHRKVSVPLPSGRRCGIDIFGAYHRGDMFYMLPSVGAPLPRSALLPTSTVTLEGREVVAPGSPERLLEVIYGPHWRVPDPSFKFVTDPDVARHLSGYWRGERQGQRLWRQIHTDAGAPSPDDDTSFAAWVHEQIEPGSPVVELGCGGGADAAWLAEHGHPVHATDYASTGLSRTRSRGRRLPPTAAPLTASLVNLRDLPQVLRFGAELARADRPPHLIARDLLGELSRVNREDLWRLARMAQRRGGLTLLEQPLDLPPESRDRRRVPHLRPGRIADQITRAGGSVVSRETFGDEPQRIERMVVRWDC
jgi:hypothetical protein